SSAVGTDRPRPGPGAGTAPPAMRRGPMGAGQSSVGRALAARLGVDFADLDPLIVEADGRTIPEIFAAEGEPAFRELEAAVLARALAERTGVLALGGGAPLHPDAGELLRGRPVILLEIEEAVAARRLARGTGRPMSAVPPTGIWRHAASTPATEGPRTWPVPSSGPCSSTCRPAPRRRPNEYHGDPRRHPHRRLRRPRRPRPARTGARPGPRADG